MNKKLPTGIAGLDEIFEGGIPVSKVVLVKGKPGSGKTVFLNEFLYRGIEEYSDNGVYVTFEEPKEDIINNVSSFGFNYEKLIEENRLAFVDFSTTREIDLEGGAEFNFDVMLKRIRHAVEKINAKRIVIDSIDNLLVRFKDKNQVRIIISMINAYLKTAGLSAVISGFDEENSEISKYIEYLSDVLFKLYTISGEQTARRKMEIQKVRGASYRSGAVEYEITSKGIKFYPKIPVSHDVMKTSFTKRKSTGVETLDKITGGGIPEGHLVMLSGNTGSGKTLAGMKFLKSGIDKDEAGVYVAMEETRDQVIKTAEAHGWNFKKYQKENKLDFCSEDPIDLKIDKLLYEILDTVDRLNAKRVFLDSITTLKSASHNQENVRQFLIQFTSALKKRGVTAFISSLSSISFGAEKGQLLYSVKTNDLRLSSIIDGVIFLLYVERDSEVKKILNVLKMRGSKHSKNIYTYKIKKGGITDIAEFKSQ